MIVVYVLTSQPIQFDRMGMFVLICVLTSLVAQSIGILIGAGLSVEAGLIICSLNFFTCAHNCYCCKFFKYCLSMRRMKALSLGKFYSLLFEKSIEQCLLIV